MDATNPTTRGFTSSTRSSAWRSRLARTTAVAVGVMTVAGAAIVGPTTAASAATATAAGDQRACAVTQLLFNRGFELPRVADNGGAWQLFPNGSPWLGWQSFDGNVELWRTLGTPDSGFQHAEVNANGDHNVIWQNFRTVPRTWLTWSVAVKARDFDGAVNWDTVIVRINGSVVGVRTADENGWRVIRGTYRVPRGVWLSRISFQVGRHDGPAGYGGLVDSASVRGLRCW